MRNAKPRVTPVSSEYFRVSYRGLEGAIRRDSARNWSAIYIPANSCAGTRLAHRCSTGADALAALVSRMDEIADSDAQNISADAFENKGGRARLAALGGDKALAAFDAAKAQLAAHDDAGLVLVQSMIKIASKKRIPKAQTITVLIPWRKTSVEVTIVPGFSIAIADGPTYFIGGRAEYDSYNLHYFGTIHSITLKTVTIAPNTGAKRRLRLVGFVSRNEAEIADKVARNVETSYYI